MYLDGIAVLVLINDACSMRMFLPRLPEAGTSREIVEVLARPGGCHIFSHPLGIGH